MSNLLSIKNLCVHFKTQDLYVKALKGISFSIEKGESLGVVGESGSGKSVTALSLMRLLAQPPAEITQGEILFHKEDLLKKSEKQMRKVRGNQISMIFQEPMTSLNPVFTIGYQIDEALILHQNMSQKIAREKSIELLNQVGIVGPKERVNSYPHELSGGQRQRALIAMAIACKPQLLIADEPTTALDVTIQKQILQLLKKIQQEMNMSILFISHDLAVISQIAQRVLVMQKGEIVEEGLTSKIFKNPKKNYTKGLIACRPTLEIQTSRLPMISDFQEGKEIKLPLKEKKEFKGEILIKVVNLSKHFPLKKSFFGKSVSIIKAVDKVSFEVEKGSTLGLVGESGCGKTTLGRTILQLTQSSGGDVFYKDINLSKISKRKLKLMRRKMQIIFQDPYASLNPRMTVGSSIMEPMLIHNLYSSKTERVERVEYLLEQVGLKKDMIHRYPHEFSGGQRQRICIARAISIKPEFIVCDESVSSLDVSIQAQILNLLKDLQEKLNLTYIFISHDLAVVKFISDKVAVMKEGKIVEYKDSNELYTRPENPYTHKLLESIPSISFS
ncbi:MAG: ABC transporter ATP-binding protein [Bdellovibrionales bacterium]|nr:ABC transporter ATP-binding protein [Bdellovibrionales bacterium]